MPQDWLVAFDDLLTHRLSGCTVCGDRERWYWGIAAVGALVLAYVLCQACDRQDLDCRRVEVVLGVRYGTEAQEGS